MKLFYNLLIGILIGAGAILPGISSGVLCVIFGIYDKLINSVLEFFNDVKTNFKFLFPIVIGIGIGIILFGNILKSIFATYPIQTKFAFLGLILGCVPNLFKIANSKKGFRLHYLFYTIVSFILTLILLVLENQFTTRNFVSTQNPLFLILSGFIMSIGIVVPGVSNTVLLMILGSYEIYLNAVSSVDISILFPMGIGLVVGGLLFLKLAQYFMQNYFSQTYYTIIGFVLGSLLILYPGFEFSFTGIISLIIFVLCFYVGKMFENS
ncbi:MAG: DUF368 domain-containing protein [Clostridia bacterium]|nr:DUF368 domain-containing protein [Clostridia bacterium]